MAAEAKAAIAAHERVCSERWETARDSMHEIKLILAWGMGTMVTCMIGLIGFLALHPIVH